MIFYGSKYMRIQKLYINYVIIFILVYFFFYIAIEYGNFSPKPQFIIYIYFNLTNYINSYFKHIRECRGKKTNYIYIAFVSDIAIQYERHYI